MLGVCSNRFTESILRTLHKITATTAMHVHLDTARHHIHTLGINNIGTDYGQVTIRYFENLVVTQNDRTILEPSLRRKDTSINNLSQHI